MTDWRDELREFMAANTVEPAKTLGELVTLLPPPTSEDIEALLAELTNPQN
jgi:hypothetical protein